MGWGGVPHPHPADGVSHPRFGQGGGTPSQVWTGGGWYPIPGPNGGRYHILLMGLDGYLPPPSKTGWGTPCPRLHGVPPPPSSMTALGTPPPPNQETDQQSQQVLPGGVPLAFTQEDSLVKKIFFRNTQYNSLNK